MLRKASPFDRASLIRHLGICVSALIAYLARQELHVENSVLWVFAFASLFNLQTVLLSNRPRIGPLARLLSPLFGLGGWTALVLLTGGVGSPFVAGLSLEIILAAITSSSIGIALITGGAAAGLWIQQFLIGFGSIVLPLSLQTGFLVALGGLTCYVARRWKRSEEQLSRRLEEIHRRLQGLEKDLDEARVVGKLGEGVARLAHGLKNAAHSLRGFARLIEPRLSGTERDLELLDGLRTAIDRLQELSRATLGPPGPSSKPCSGPVGVDAPGVVREVVNEIAPSFPEVHCSLSFARMLPSMQTSSAVIREVLGIVVRNAAEAMDGRGEIAVAVSAQRGTIEFRVRDHGLGIPEQDQERIFEPGYTTKLGGHGFGLYLARRLLESHGGSLRMAAAEGGGNLCSIELPCPTESSVLHEEPIRSGC